jgi:hypothetical protein
MHTACCGKNTWTATQGSLTVFINGKGAHRLGDQTRHCGGSGHLVEGSPNVMVGESTNVVAAAFRQASATAAEPLGSAGSSRGSDGSPSGFLPFDTGSRGSARPPTAESSDVLEPSVTESVESGFDPDPGAIDVRAQAETLRQAASAHYPFCEECERLKAPRQQP